MSEWNIIWEARGAFLNGALNTLILFVLSVLAAGVDAPGGVTGVGAGYGPGSVAQAASATGAAGLRG